MKGVRLIAAVENTSANEVMVRALCVKLALHEQLLKFAGVGVGGARSEPVVVGQGGRAPVAPEATTGAPEDFHFGKGKKRGPKKGWKLAKKEANRVQESGCNCGPNEECSKCSLDFEPAPQEGTSP